MASNVISPGGNEQLNHHRMTRVVGELFRDVLWEIFNQHAKPCDIPSHIKPKPKGRDLRASDVDVSNLYQLLRKHCPGLKPPTNGCWGKEPLSPQKTIPDDIERMRCLRNNHFHNRPEVKIPDDMFNKECEAILEMMKRIDSQLHTTCTTFENRLSEIRNCTLDHEHVKQLAEHFKQLREDMDKQQTREDAVEGRLDGHDKRLENVVTKEELDKRLAVEPISRKRPGVTSLTERRSKTSQSAKVVPPRSADKDDVESEIYRQDSITSPDSGSFRICSTSSSSTSLDFDIDFAKYKHDMPPEIKIGYYDCLILYCEDDRKVARLFCDHLINDIVLQKHGPVRAVLYDSAELISLTEAKLKRLEMGVARCTYVFVYLTEQFVADKWMDVSSEICLMKAINDPEKQWSVVPVYTEKPSECRFKIPTILDRLIGIDYYKIDSHYQIRVARLIQDRIATRVENEKRHRLEQKTWIEEKKRSDADQEMEFKKLALKEERKTEEHKLTKTEEHKLTEEQHLQPPSFTTVDSDIQDNFNFHEWAISSGLKSPTIRLLEAEDLDTRESLFHLADDMIQIDQSLTTLSLGQKILLKTSIRKLINVVYDATIQITSEEYSAEIAAAGRNIHRLAITQKITEAIQKLVSDSIPGQALIRIVQYGRGSLMVTFDIDTDGQQTEEEIRQLLIDMLTSGNLSVFTVSLEGFVFNKIREDNYRPVTEPNPSPEWAALGRPDIYIDFGFLQEGIPVDMTQQFFFKPCVHSYDPNDCDFAVLELRDNDVGGTMPEPFTYFADPKPNGLFHLIGHSGGKRKHFARVEGIIDWNRENNQKHLTEARAWSKALVKDNHGNGRDGYLGADNPHRVIFRCGFEQGASGSPGIVVKADGRAVVVTMLVHGFPDWIYDDKVDVMVKQQCTPQHRIEQGTNLRSIYDYMSQSGLFPAALAVRDAIFGNPDGTLLA